MKNIFFLFLIIISVILIYMFANKDKDLVFSLGQDTGDINYISTDYRITDIIIDIENNINIDGYDIQNLLVKATTINIDLNQYMYIKDYSSIISQIKDLEDLYKLIRKYSKENINVQLLPEEDILYEYANKKIILLFKKYDIMVVR